ncbi:MAG: hypothetical protein JNK38_01150 [Acidobacteria bacterium]|nr:hypothetical protein [Acidobacteriota bacterium]
MIEGKTEQETVELTARVLGVSEAQARIIIAIETGQIEGDELPAEK